MGQVIFDPMLMPLYLWGMTGALGVLIVFGLWRGTSAWPLRILALGGVVLALWNPSIKSENRTALPDVALVVVDRTASQTVSDRLDQTTVAQADLMAKLTVAGVGDVKVVDVTDSPDDAGTRVLTTVIDALSDMPQDRLAGIFVISDGRAHDAALRFDPPAPFHLLRTGRTTDWDKRLVVTDAPAFGILGEPLGVTVRVETQGAAPDDSRYTLNLSVDGGAMQSFDLPPNKDVTLEYRLPHGGKNILHLTTPVDDGELTDRNNSAVISVTGIRDRLRVLLVSGEPHAGERTWRNLLKSDSAVDLVHFTILRPLGKSDNVPLNELALIAFPTDELFLDKINEFDLIVFDRYKRRGILSQRYFASMKSYVQNGGAILVAAGPAFAGVDSLYRSPLSEILPGFPTARVFEEPFKPMVSDDGLRHPITRDLTDTPDAPNWGRWLRHVEIAQMGGHVLMTGVNGSPLLLVDRAGQGRVALLASDHAWLWDRGFEGGGPQAELLRRLSHWMMKEPDLEEETLFATDHETGLIITRRTMQADINRAVMVTLPDGTDVPLMMDQIAPGEYQAQLTTDELGLFRFQNGDLSGVVARGPTAPREFTNAIASDADLIHLIDMSNGGSFAVEDGVPNIRAVRAGRVAAGRNWMGIVPRGASAVADVRVAAALPTWVYLLMSAGLMVLAWVREGR